MRLTWGRIQLTVNMSSYSFLLPKIVGTPSAKINLNLGCQV